MVMVDQQVIEAFNRPGRIGILASVDKNGQPNMAYFGSAKILPGGEFILGLGNNRTLSNLEQNPLAVFMVLEGSPVTFKTPGWRLYLKLKTMQREGELIESIRENVGPKAAGGIKAGLLFDITEVRSLVG